VIKTGVTGSKLLEIISEAPAKEVEESGRNGLI